MITNTDAPQPGCSFFVGGTWRFRSFLPRICIPHQQFGRVFPTVNPKRLSEPIWYTLHYTSSLVCSCIHAKWCTQSQGHLHGSPLTHRRAHSHWKVERGYYDINFSILNTNRLPQCDSVAIHYIRFTISYLLSDSTHCSPCFNLKFRVRIPSLGCNGKATCHQQQRAVSPIPGLFCEL